MRGSSFKQLIKLSKLNHWKIQKTAHTGFFAHFSQIQLRQLSTGKKGKKKHSDYYNLSNRKMIEVFFSSRVSLLVFYSSEKVLSAQVCSLACVSITAL